VNQTEAILAEVHSRAGQPFPIVNNFAPHMHDGSITIRIAADVREIERLNRVVRQFGELHEIPGRTLYSVNLALDELVSNVILYGYDDPAGQQIQVKIAIEGPELHAWLEDGGREFDPATVPLPKLDEALGERQIGGLGIHLVKSLMDKLEYRREGAKNLLTLRKRIR
jgi:anti-sigma regulatory factor (Ser/Thr protein kinase)